MADFPSKLKAIRIQKGLTQQKLASLLDVSQNAIYNWENGKREPSMDMQKKIAKAFDIPLYILLDDNYEVPDINSDAWKNSARFVAVKKNGKTIPYTELEKPPMFTTSVSSSPSIKNNISNKTTVNDSNQSFSLEEWEHLKQNYATGYSFAAGPENNMKYNDSLRVNSSSEDKERNRIEQKVKKNETLTLEEKQWYMDYAISRPDSEYVWPQSNNLDILISEADKLIEKYKSGDSLSNEEKTMLIKYQNYLKYNINLFEAFFQKWNETVDIIQTLYALLNEEGQKKMVEYMKDLAKIPEYQTHPDSIETDSQGSAGEDNKEQI